MIVENELLNLLNDKEKELLDSIIVTASLMGYHRYDIKDLNGIMFDDFKNKYLKLFAYPDKLVLNCNWYKEFMPIILDVRNSDERLNLLEKLQDML